MFCTVLLEHLRKIPKNVVADAMTSRAVCNLTVATKEFGVRNECEHVKHEWLQSSHSPLVRSSILVVVHWNTLTVKPKDPLCRSSLLRQLFYHSKSLLLSLHQYLGDTLVRNLPY